jgi:hypothetical protein
MSSLRPLAIVGMLMALGTVAPVHAALTTNATTTNALTTNALTTNALTTNALTTNALVATGSVIADLNGVAVEGISLPYNIHR